MNPCLLIASPQMRDPFFERTVVLVWHHDADGAIGVVVNRVLDHVLPDVIDLADVDLSHYSDNRVAWGGPVETSSGTVLTRGQIADQEGWSLQCGVAVTRSQDALTRLIESREDLMLCLGYAGWGPGQLDQEIADGGWLFTDAKQDIIFSGEADDRYERALETLGLTPHSLWMKPIPE